MKEPCDFCDGTTDLVCDYCWGDCRDPDNSKKACPSCSGTGKHICNRCLGTGFEPKPKAA